MSFLGLRGSGGGSSPSSRRSPAALLLVCAAFGPMLLVGCGGEGSTMATAASGEAAQTNEGTTAADAGGSESSDAVEIGDFKDAGGSESSDAVEIGDFKYDPGTVTVKAGTKLTWTNGDEAPHTATADDGSFDTGALKLDGEGTVTVDQPGTYSYFCRFHPFMKATLEVQ